MRNGSADVPSESVRFQSNIGRPDVQVAKYLPSGDMQTGTGKRPCGIEATWRDSPVTVSQSFTPDFLPGSTVSIDASQRPSSEMST